jgi:hypothetical protein
MCWECVSNKALLDSEGKLEISKATVFSDLMALLRLKLISNK